MTIQVLSQVRGSFTAGSADAFASQEIITNIDTTGIIYAWDLKRIEFDFGGVSGAASADSNMVFGVTRDNSVTAQSDASTLLSSAQCLLRRGFELVTQGTAANQHVMNRVHVYDFPPGSVIADPSLTVWSDFTATGLTPTTTWRLTYESVRITESDYIKLVRGFF